MDFKLRVQWRKLNGKPRRQRIIRSTQWYLIKNVFVMVQNRYLRMCGANDAEAYIYSTMYMFVHRLMNSLKFTVLDSSGTVHQKGTGRSCRKIRNSEIIIVKYCERIKRSQMDKVFSKTIRKEEEDRVSNHEHRSILFVFHFGLRIY